MAVRQRPELNRVLMLRYDLPPHVVERHGVDGIQTLLLDVLTDPIGDNRIRIIRNKQTVVEDLDGNRVPVESFDPAIHRARTDAQGNRVEEAQWVRVEVLLTEAEDAGVVGDTVRQRLASKFNIRGR